MPVSRLPFSENSSFFIASTALLNRFIVNQAMAFGKLPHACVLRQWSIPVPWSDFCSIACEFVRHVDSQDSCCLKLYTETF